MTRGNTGLTDLGQSASTVAKKILSVPKRSEISLKMAQNRKIKNEDILENTKQSASTNNIDGSPDFQANKFLKNPTLASGPIKSDQDVPTGEDLRRIKKAKARERIAAFGANYERVPHNFQEGTLPPIVDPDSELGKHVGRLGDHVRTSMIPADGFQVPQCDSFTKINLEGENKKYLPSEKR